MQYFCLLNTIAWACVAIIACFVLATEAWLSYERKLRGARPRYWRVILVVLLLIVAVVIAGWQGYKAGYGCV